MRLSAIMELPVIYIFTHDSIGVGEDGPTHQPVEQLIALRTIPGLIVFRPADANEMVECWRVLMRLRDQPAALVLTRQALPTLDPTKYSAADGVEKGAYVLADAGDGKPELLLLASGSEVALSVKAYEQLTAAGIKPGVSVEQGSAIGWHRYIGSPPVAPERSTNLIERGRVQLGEPVVAVATAEEKIPTMVAGGAESNDDKNQRG